MLDETGCLPWQIANKLGVSVEEIRPILNPEPPSYEFDGFCGNEFAQLYGNAVTENIAWHLANSYWKAQYRAHQEGFRRIVPRLEMCEARERQRVKQLDHADFRLMQLVEGNAKTDSDRRVWPLAVGCCVTDDMREALGIAPAPFSIELVRGLFCGMVPNCPAVPDRGPVRSMTTPMLAAALDYAAIGLSVIPIRPNSKAAAVHWKPYQQQRADESQLRQWFGNDGDRGIGVVLGQVSGGTCCRDFDVRASYERWAAEQRILAATLPTATTARGQHVYFRSHFHGFVDLGDGEYRGDGHYCLLPPSRHPDGAVHLAHSARRRDSRGCRHQGGRVFTP